MGDETTWKVFPCVTTVVFYVDRTNSVNLDLIVLTVALFPFLNDAHGNVRFKYIGPFQHLNTLLSGKSSPLFLLCCVLLFSRPSCCHLEL